MDKIDWQGRIVSVQPRILLTRSFDERSHSYLGYSLVLEGDAGGEWREFSVGVGKATQARHAFRVGDLVSGQAVPVTDRRVQPVELYRASRLSVLERVDLEWDPPPWHGVPPDLETYRWRGHRRLSPRTYSVRCRSCIWGCRMPVEMIIDPWNPRMQYRFETFCYGPKSCPSYRGGRAGWFLAGKACASSRKTGSTRTQLRTGTWTSRRGRRACARYGSG